MGPAGALAYWLPSLAPSISIRSIPIAWSSGHGLVVVQENVHIMLGFNKPCITPIKGSVRQPV
jgi:hypothetical protein